MVLPILLFLLLNTFAETSLQSSQLLEVSLVLWILIFAIHFFPIQVIDGKLLCVLSGQQCNFAILRQLTQRGKEREIAIATQLGSLRKSRAEHPSNMTWICLSILAQAEG